MTKRVLLVLALFAVVAALPATAADQPKNIILLIADGWGFEHIAATDYFTAGETGIQVYEKTFTPLAMSTYSANGFGYDPEAVAADFEYVKEGATDSAAAATAMASGYKTTNGAIGVDAAGQRLESVLEKAEHAGKKTGVVTSVQFSHATPAGFVAHSPSRGDYEEIAQKMILESAVDVIIGAGHPWFDANGRCLTEIDKDGHIATSGSYKYVGGPEMWTRLLAGGVGADADGDGVDDPWCLVQTRQELLHAAANPPERLIGVVQSASTLQKDRAGIDDNTKDDAPNQCPRNADIPALAEMARTAINVLASDPDGFVLMIEGGAVDWANHANEAGRMIEEMTEFNATVEMVVEWVEANSTWDETLVIVTGDHETGYLTGSSDVDAFHPVENRGKGNMPAAVYHSDGHTNSLIPLFVKGPGSERFVASAVKKDHRRGAYLDNTDLGRILGQSVAGN
jgi:alkaline phosphatase